MQVTDVNDELPEFSKSSYTFSIPEGTSVNAPVGTVQAADPDLNKQISYTISFAVNYSSDGEVVEMDTVSFSKNFVSFCSQW